MPKKLVPGEGLEPTHPLGQRILSPPRLPFRHPGFSSWGYTGSNLRAIWLFARGQERGARIALEGMEATGGFEPPNRGFADLRLNHLATSPRFAT